MGRWSRLVAVEFLQWLAASGKSRWLDVGCGTGMLSRTILDLADPAEVRGIDRAAGFIAQASSTIRDPRARFELVEGESLALGPGTYDVVVSGLVLNFLPDAGRAVSEIRYATRPGGVVAAYVWDYADKMELLRVFWDAAASLDPDAGALDEGRRFPLCSTEKLHGLFAGQGLKTIDERAIDIRTHFGGFQDYWSPFLSGQGPAPTYVASLTSNQLSELRERIRAMLPVARNGTIDLNARALAVRGYS